MQLSIELMAILQSNTMGEIVGGLMNMRRRQRRIHHNARGAHLQSGMNVKWVRSISLHAGDWLEEEMSLSIGPAFVGR